MPEHEETANVETKPSESTAKLRSTKANRQSLTRATGAAGDAPVTKGTKKPKVKVKSTRKTENRGVTAGNPAKKTKPKASGTEPAPKGSEGAPGGEVKEKKTKVARKAAVSENIVELQVPAEMASTARIEIYDLERKTQLGGKPPGKSGKVTFKVKQPGKYLVKYLVDGEEMRKLEVEATTS
jgi:hypothetical protein